MTDVRRGSAGDAPAPGGPWAVPSYVLAGSAAWLGLAVGRALLPGGGGPVVAAVAAACLLAVGGAGLAHHVDRACAWCPASAAPLTALGAVSVAAVATVWLQGAAGLVEAGTVALAVVLASTAVEAVWLAGFAAAAGLTAALAVTTSSPPASWPGPLAVLGAGVATAALLDVRRRTDARHLSGVLASVEADRVRDPLTGSASRAALLVAGASLVASARRQGDAAFCLLCQVEGLPRVRERHGRQVADTVLVAVAETVRPVVRETDVVARWGDDMFCVVGPGAGVPAFDLERRVRERLMAAPPVPPATWEPSVVAVTAMLAPWDAGDLEALLDRAEQEMGLRRALLPPQGTVWGRRRRDGRADTTA